MSGKKHVYNANTICLDKCPGGYQQNVSDVNPSDIQMSAEDIEWAGLHNAGRLLWCMACGCVWERYHDEVGVCLDKIGMFNRFKSTPAFERYISPS
jgi:hypothetical protein